MPDSIVSRDTNANRNAWRRIRILVLIAILLGALFLLKPVWQGYEAVLLLADVVGQPLPAWLDLRPQATRRLVTYERGTRTYSADFYLSNAGAQAGIVFVAGAAEHGKDDPRVTAFSTSLARSRFAVLVPDVVALRELRLLPETEQDIADALDWLFAQPELAHSGRVGVLTTSVALGPAVLALLRPELSSRVNFVVAIGGYHDLPRTLGYLTTGRYEAHGVTLQRPPKEYGKWVYALSNAVRLDDPRERAAFETLARRKFVDPQADVGAELERLGPVGNQVYQFIVNTDPARSGALLEQLPKQLRDDVERLNLAAHDLRAVRAQFILVHGAGDDMIPYGESISLAKALPAGQAELFVLSDLEHVDLTPKLREAWQLWRAIYAVLTQR
jgi:hypothetical protein